MRPGRTGPPVRDALPYPCHVCPACSILAPKPEPCTLTRCPHAIVEVASVVELRAVCAKGKR